MGGREEECKGTHELGGKMEDKEGIERDCK